MFAALVFVEAAANKGILDMHGLTQDWQFYCIHVVTMHPHLTDYNICGPLTLNLCRRGPVMLGQVAQ
jgi:hypothetical protein